LRSGSLITARLAADFGRVVFAVPGSVDSELSRGPHSLVREGAVLATGPAEVLADLGFTAPADPLRPEPPSDPLEAGILAALEPSTPRGVEEILERTGAGAPAVLAALLRLELAGRIREIPGRRYVRPPGE
jgi:DNA processing protein